MEDLRSQLLKAGLVSEKQVRKAEQSSARNRRGRRGKNPKPDEADKASQESEQALARERDVERQRQRDKHARREEQRLAREAAERRRREAAEAGRRIIGTHGRELGDDGPVAYNFAEGGRTMRTVQVTEAQRRQLGCGELGIAQPHANLRRYVLLPRAAAEELRRVCPDKLLLLHDPESEPDEFDGLMW